MSYGRDWLFSNEYPMILFLERNGYDVSYTTDVDSDRRGNLIRNHKAFLSVGHDESWSGNERTNVEAARDAGLEQVKAGLAVLQRDGPHPGRRIVE